MFPYLSAELIHWFMTWCNFDRILVNRTVFRMKLEIEAKFEESRLRTVMKAKIEPQANAHPQERSEYVAR